jgi:galactonate dehydratase
MPKAAITDLRAWALRQPEDRTEYTVVRIDTVGGVSGWGESSASEREFEPAKAALVGQDATSAESVRRRLAGETPAVRAAVNLALLDILGKLCKAPAYDVLSGATRQKARALAPLQGTTEAEWTESLKRAR